MSRTDDDITAICSLTGFDPTVYRSFTPDNNQVAQELPAEEQAESKQRSATENIASVTELPINTTESQFEYPRRNGPRWRALRSAFDKVHRGSSLPVGDHASRTLPAGSVSLLGGCGGVGVTTIIATLGRMLSMSGERVLMVDGAVESMLPLYFGAADATSGSCSFLPQWGGDDGSLFVVSRTAEEAAGGGTELWQKTQRLASSTDRFLVDIWRDMPASDWQMVAGESVCLVVLIPDLHSAVRLRMIEQSFRDRERMLGRRVLPFYLLNKFDSSLPLHVDLRNGLAQELGDRLLPFSIRRSDEVTHALAEGMTVADYAPNSAITQDFRLLLEWLQAARLARRASA